MGVEIKNRAAQGVRRWEVLALILILAVAAITRLARPDLTEFKADEGRLLTAALTMSDGQFAYRGISSSVGFPNAPMSVWLYSIPLTLWQHPYAATLFTGLLSMAAVGGVYWLGRRYWGIRASAVAALMLAFSPWAIVFSRKIWAQDLLPAFAVGWAIAAAMAFVEGRRAFIIVHLVCLAVAVQIHPSAIALIPATLLFLIVFRRRVDWRTFLLGGLISALTAAPFLWYLWGRWRADGGLPFSAGQATAQISLDSIRQSLAIISGQGVSALAGTNYDGLPGEVAIRFLWLAFILLGVVWAMGQVARRWDEPSAQVAFICLCWFLAPALFFIWHRTPVYIHYFIIALPAPFLLAGAFFDEWMEGLEPRLRALGWSALILTLVFQLATWGSVMAAVARNPMAGGFGTPLGTKLAAAGEARRLLNETGATEVLLVGDGSNPEQEDFPAEFRALLHGIDLRYVDLNTEALFPATAAVVLLDTVAADSPTSTRELFLEVAGTWETYRIPGGDFAYTVRALPPAAQPPAAVELSPMPLLANFVRITGHNDLRAVNEGELWDVYWRTADNPDPASYHLFNHLLDNNGQRLAQADAPAFAGSQWRPGDVVVSRFLIPFANQARSPQTMRIGMYRFPSLENVPVLDEAANPAADAVDISLTQ